MCIFSKKVTVKKTKIFVANVKVKKTKKKQQLTIYENYVKSEEDNIMILPYPINEDDDVIDNEISWLNMDENSNFFKVINKCFPQKILSEGIKEIQNFEPVTIGESKFTNTNSIEYLEGLSNMSSEVLLVLKKFYSKGFGFLAFEFKKGHFRNLPIAYLTPKQDKLFVPLTIFHNGKELIEMEKLDNIIYSVSMDWRAKEPIEYVLDYLKTGCGFTHIGESFSTIQKVLEKMGVSTCEALTFGCMDNLIENLNQDIHLDIHKTKVLKFSSLKRKRLNY